MDYENYGWGDCTFPFDYCKPLYNYLKGTLLKRGLEIGFDSGSSALVFLAACPQARLISVDARPMAELTTGLDLLRKHEVLNRFTFIQNDSHRQMAEMIAEGTKFDYIYIDGDHLYEGAKKDIEDAIRLLAPGGVIICDDADPNHKEFGVGRAIIDIVKFFHDGEQGAPRLLVSTVPGHINKAMTLQLI